MSLSERQTNAAHRLGQDVCVVAGPGSGKTSVLIERFTWLVSERGIDPGRILAITFTDKAATEIKQRMVRAFAHAPEIREQIERAYVSTIHGFCARLLRENAIEAGIDPQFEVLEQPGKLLRQVADEVLEAIYNEQPQRMRRFLRSLAVSEKESQWVPDLASSLIAIYEGMRIAGAEIRQARLVSAPVPYGELQGLALAVLNEGLRPTKDIHADYLDWCREVVDLARKPSVRWFQLLAKANFNKTQLPMRSVARETQVAVRESAARLRVHLLIEYYNDERNLIIESLERIDAVYRQRKREHSSVDFDDLEEFAIQLLETDAGLRTRLQAGFDHILMDELQDTNPLQWKLLGLIRRPDAFFAVGDINQSIFGFRYAEPELYAQYRTALEQKGQKIDELRANYRSRPELLGVVNATFAGPAPGIEAHELTSGRDDFFHQVEPAVDILITNAENTEAAERVESLWVARRICELVDRFQYRDIAILTRANMALGELQRALDEYRIPSLVLGGLTFYETREVRDLILLLSVLVNPRNEVALAGLLRSPLFGVSDEDLLLLSAGGTLYEGVRRKPPANWEVIRELRAIRNCVSPDQLLRRVPDDCDYESGLTGRGRANVEKFLSALRSRYQAQPGSLSDALDYIRDASPEAEAPPADFGDAVRLMTIHKSKGLEFPVVFLPYLHRDRGTGTPIIGYTHPHGLGVKWRDPATRRGVPDASHEKNKQLAERMQAGEENRLLYVGMTRAKSHMVLSYSTNEKRKPGPWARLIAQQLVETRDPRVSIIVTSAAPEPMQAPPPDAIIPANVYVDRQDRQDQHDSTASITDISVFAQCPRKYYLSRYIGWEAGPKTFVDIEELPRVDSGELEASEIGTQVHQILGRIPIEQPAPEAVELADRFLTSDLGKRALRATRIEREYDFLVSIDSLVLRGQIDLWFEQNRELIVVDYKTDQAHKPIDPRRVHSYALQLQLYAIALEQIAGRPVTRAYLHFLRPNELVEVDLSPLQLNAAREHVRAFIKAQDVLEYPLSTGDHCFRCAYYKEICPARRSLAIAASRS
jgi:ATP-dependent exoDNAse (exonuclease V) beta subunit